MLVAALALAAANPTIAFTIDPRHRLVEGIASDGRALYVSSIIDRTIVRCTTRCVDAWTLPVGLHPMGMAWDEQRKRLWIAADCPKLPGGEPCASGALLAYDRGGKLRTRVAAAGEFHPGDVSADGEVVISDSGNGAVYRVSGTALVTIIAPGAGKSAQGSARLPDGRLIVADYSVGIAAIVDGKRTLLPRQDGKPLRGIDGVVHTASTIWAVYNGAAPGALVKIDVGADRLVYAPVETGNMLPDPTQLTVHRGALYIVADSGWATVDKQPRRASGATIVRVTLR